MVKVKKFNITGEQEGEIEWDEALLAHNANSQLIKDCITAYRHNQRQWNASTKTRAEVKCTGKKPRPQKGTGNARQGSYAATQYRGGGIAFGPRSKSNQHVHVNKKERKSAIQTLLATKIKEDNLIVLSSPQLKEPKTKVVSQFIQKGEMPKRVTFVGKEREETLYKSVRNLKYCNYSRIDQLNVYSLSMPGKIVLLESALEDAKEMLKA